MMSVCFEVKLPCHLLARVKRGFSKNGGLSLTQNVIMLVCTFAVRPIGIGRVMMKTPHSAHRPQDSLPRKDWGWMW